MSKLEIELDHDMQAVLDYFKSTLGVSETEAVKRCLLATGASVKKVFGVVSTPATSVTPPVVEKARVQIDGVMHQNKTYKGLLLDVLKTLGVKRVFENYPEDAPQQLVFNHRPDDKKAEHGEDISEGRFRFWVHTSASADTVRKFIKTAAESLKEPVEFP